MPIQVSLRNVWGGLGRVPTGPWVSSGLSATHAHERASQGMWACEARPSNRLRLRSGPATLRGVSFDFVTRVPTPAEHRLLAESVGWHDAFAWEAMPASLEASLAGVLVLDDGGPIGSGSRLTPA